MVRSHIWGPLPVSDRYSISIFTKESMKAYKSLEAYKYVVSGHVRVVLSHQISNDCAYVALSSKVTPSQRARDKPYELWVYLEKKIGTVYCAHCTCMAGLGEVCSHVGALLFKVTPATVTEIYDQIKGRRKKDVPNVHAHGSSPLPSTSDLQLLYVIAPKSVFFTSVTIPGIEILPPVKKPEPTDKFPKHLTSLHQFDDSPNADFINDTFNNYTVTESHAFHLEEATRNQAVSPLLWFEHRKGRLTASKAHDVLRMREQTSPDNLVRRVCGYNNYDLSRKDAVRWCIEHEDEARIAYFSHQKTTHINLECKLAGFFVNSKHPFVGASPDGITTCDCCGKGTLEVKCPFKHKDTPIDKVSAKDSNFCLDNMLQLKQNHRYYTQVQLQMYLTESSYSDFVVYTKCDSPSMVIVRLNLDLDFCKTLLSKCDSFVKDHVIHELITQKLNNMPVTQQSTCTTKTMNNNDQPSTWCFCAEPEYGRMIKCDNRECPYQWFHYKCVNVRRKPKVIKVYRELEFIVKSGSDMSGPSISEYFILPKDACGKVRAQCKLCTAVISGHTKATSNFLTHLKLKSKYAKTDSRQIDLNNATVEFIAGNLLPLSTVESAKFKKLCEKLDPKFQVSSRKYLANKLIVDKANRIQDNLKDQLSKAQNICLTLDLWSNRQMSAFLGITGHFVSDWELWNFGNLDRVHIHNCQRWPGGIFPYRHPLLLWRDFLVLEEKFSDQTDVD
ncbi:unnamed protein product [Mytilus coruscus]|uniref:SWIM-type domain-containing protein n=1 Tax=Mytilus coruscus TaxID=42192 RepID=A0A6J7ZWL4_MYTCO|nr:unnamed protein product [Mytilus coruscus]